MPIFFELNIELNNVNRINQNCNARIVHGYSINELDNIVYSNPYDNDNELLPMRVNCKYIDVNNLGEMINNNYLCTLSHNIRSMFKNFINFKVEVLENGKSIDLIGLCETHLTDDKEKLYALDHYNLYTTNILSNKGGVCIYVRDSIPCRQRSDLSRKLEHLEAVFVECIINNKKLVIGMIYRRPGTNVNLFLEDISDLLENISSLVKKYLFLINFVYCMSLYI